MREQKGRHVEQTDVEEEEENKTASERNRLALMPSLSCFPLLYRLLLHVKHLLKKQQLGRRLLFSFLSFFDDLFLPENCVPREIEKK